MCGIAGFIHGGSATDLGAPLRAMARAIAHRGPDDEGFFETVTRDGQHAVGLAHRRLSIIDLNSGHQPMGNETGRVQIVFNGEIYNFAGLRDELIGCGHRFATASDTETIVHAYEQWGTDCVSRLDGMFAFALWDADRERLLLARDRFGKKPLFLAEVGPTLLFASEIKALMAWPGLTGRLDKGQLHDYLAYRYVPGPATLFEGVRKLMPGSWALWQRENGAARLVEQRYYRPPDGEALSAPLSTDADPVGAFLAELDTAVQVRMVSDVPFGAFLSGGIDSSAVVALMSRHHGSPVKTFSVGFAEARYSELAHAAAVACQFGTEHHELVVAQDALIEHLPTIVRYRDAPVCEPSDIPIYLLSREARRQVKMVLTGEGADEVLGGYPKHVFERHAQAYAHVPAALRRALIEPLVEALPYRFHRAKTAMATLALTRFEQRMPRWFGALSSDGAERLLAPGLPPPSRAHGIQFDSAQTASALRRVLFFDQTSWLPDNLLERGDRMTMAASLEARMPFMDHRLCAFVSALPDAYRVRGRTTKWILRQAMARLLPPAILKRPKVGFRVPVNEWFRGPLQGYLRDQLTGRESKSAALYDPARLKQVINEHTGGRRNHEKLLWTLLTLEVWHRECLSRA